MDVFEEMVMGFLTRDCKTFVIPQFSIKSNGIWSCPDFVAISPAIQKCHVVEVSTAYNLNNLAHKVRNKDNQWIGKLKEQLEADGVTDPDWTYDVFVFIRKSRINWFKNAIKDIPAVVIYEIEKIFPPWEPYESCEVRVDHKIKAIDRG